MMARKIGAANCPNCGRVEISNIESVIVYFGRGTAPPYAQITCERCNQDFAATLTWQVAYAFDELGCAVVGFSKATAELFTDNDIEVFLADFDAELEVFLTIVDLEAS